MNYFDFLNHSDPKIVMWTEDAIEKITEEHPFSWRIIKLRSWLLLLKNFFPVDNYGF